MHFLAYAVDQWQTEVLGKVLEIDSRKHLLSFFVKRLRPCRFTIVHTVNREAFLDVPPGLLLCDSVLVQRTTPARGLRRVDDIARAAAPCGWHLCYILLEQPVHAWNQVLEAGGLGKALGRDVPLFAPGNMTAFFGASSFPRS